MNSTLKKGLFLCGFDDKTIQILEDFFVKEKDFYIFDFDSICSNEKLKKIINENEAILIWKKEVLEATEKVEEKFQEIDKTFSDYEKQNLSIFLIFEDLGILFAHKNKFTELCNLNQNYPFLKSIFIFNDKISNGKVISPDEVRNNLIALIKLIKFTPMPELVRNGFLLSPSTFRLFSISVPYERELEVAAYDSISKILNRPDLSEIRKNAIDSITLSLKNELIESTDTILKNSLPYFVTLASGKENIFIQNYENFKNNFIFEIDKKLAEICDYFKNDFLSKLGLMHKFESEENKLVNTKEIEYFYERICENLKSEVENNESCDQIVSKIKEEILTILDKYYNEGQNYRRSLKLVLKNSVLFLISFFFWIFTDSKILHLPYIYKFFILVIFLGTAGLIWFKNFFYPKYSLKKQYYEIVGKLQNIDKKIFNSLKKFVVFGLLNKINSRKESFKNICQNIINIFFKDKESSTPSFYLKNGYIPILISHLLILKKADEDYFKRELLNIIKNALKNDCYNIEKEIIELIQIAKKKYLDIQALNIPNFWNVNIKDIQNKINELFSIFNDPIYLPKISNLKSINTIYFIATNPSLFNDLKDIGNITRIIMNAEKDIILGLWSPLSLNEASKLFNWNFEGEKYSLNFNVCKNLYDYFKKKGRTYGIMHYSEIYVKKGITQEIQELAFNLKELSKSSDSYEIANFIVSFVQQNIKYKKEEGEYPKYPIETLLDGEGDCEDFAILGASLLYCLGFRTSLLNFPEHISLGIGGIKDIEGVFYEYEGVKYYYCELTALGWKIGQIPKEWKNSNVQIIPV